jgi:uncharacterized protein (TIGR02145 family)
MTKNLNADQYQNGDAVILFQTEEEWQQANTKKIPASCYYNFDESLADHIGRLYNWYAVNDPRGLAPKGWKIPNSKDVKELFDISKDLFSALVHNKSKNDASDLKSTLGWKEDKGGSNSLGFSIRPSGLKVFDSLNIIEYDTYDDCYDDSELESIITKALDNYEDFHYSIKGRCWKITFNKIAIIKSRKRATQNLFY